MSNLNHSTRIKPLRALLLGLSLFVPATLAQEQKPPSSDQTDDVVRINTELVQTDVMVLDKEGHFVEGLKPDQFELVVDGKPQQISFFDRIAAGSANEEAQLAAARGAAVSTKATSVRGLARGRTIIFFVDDLHQIASSLTRTRKALLNFIDDEMGQNDQVEIMSASGQIGFLQQLTDNKAVLRAAVARLTLQPQPARDLQHPPMSESMALAIDSQSDLNLLKYFTDVLRKDGLSQQAAENAVKSRATNILDQSYSYTRRTLGTLESLARKAAGLPGRKLVFFISDGFLLNVHESDALDKLRNITNAAARNSVVIYTVDGRGLSVGDSADASVEIGADPTGSTSSYNTQELSASQEPLRTIAANTGGRALLNSNNSSSLIRKALQETSIYYVLAWRPDTEVKGNKFRRIEVNVHGRPELTVHVRGGYYDTAPKQTAKRDQAETRQAANKTADDEIREVLKAPNPINSLPTQVGLAFLDVPGKGLIVAALTQIDSQYISFDQTGNKQTATIDVVGVFMNDQGKTAASFGEHLSIIADPSAASQALQPNVTYNYQAQLQPGLYQVRVATRDNKNRRMGSAMQWIEIPDLTARRLSLSSLLLGGMTKDVARLKGDPAAVAMPHMSVDHSFTQTSKLRFLTYIYNAARGASDAPPDLAVQVQILLDNQPVFTTPLHKMTTEGAQDLAHLPYGAEIPLEGISPGRYVLQISVIDRIAKTSASQRTTFEIE
jgi:VWFA-related protein